MSISRRDFLGAGAAAAAGLALPRGVGALPTSVPSGPSSTRGAFVGRPVVISATNGHRSKNAIGKTGIEVAFDMVTKGSDPLDAVVAGVQVVELDPTDQSVGLGGLPNEEGVVQLDASVMHGPSKRAGSVACLEDVATAAAVAKAIMDYTDHIMLVGPGARKFAVELGFQTMNLLTEESRKDWLRWKAGLNPYDNWLDLPPRSVPPAKDSLLHLSYDDRGVARSYGTINMNAVTAAGDIASVTTTSGLSWKIPGRVGDSPIIGAGQYCDNDVGAAGSTGRGEANIKVCGAFLAVEFMRQGKTPEQALMQVMERVIAMTEKRLLDENGRPYFDLNFYAVNKKGEYAGACAYEGSTFAVCDAHGARVEKAVYLYKAALRPKGRPISGTLVKP